MPMTQDVTRTYLVYVLAQPEGTRATWRGLRQLLPNGYVIAGVVELHITFRATLEVYSADASEWDYDMSSHEWRAHRGCDEAMTAIAFAKRYDTWTEGLIGFACVDDDVPDNGWYERS